MTESVTPVLLKDSKYVQNIIININLKSQETKVISNFSAWENLALIMEGLAVTAEQCVVEGIPRKEVNQAITDYLMKVLPAYVIKQSKAN